MSPFVADAIFWVAVVACAVAQLAITRSVLVARQPAPEALPAGTRVGPANRPVELGWAILPAVGLAAVLVLTWQALHPADAPVATVAPGAVVAEVTP